MPLTLFYSENESQILGLKIGRCNEEVFDANLLLKEILEGEYDLCRLKVAAEDEMAAMKLHQMGLPHFYSGSIRRYKTLITENPSGDFLHPQMSYELYDGSQNHLLKEMLVGTWGTYPLGYYRSPYLCHLVSKELEIESVFQFYKKNNLPQNNPNNSILFMNDGGKYVGFFALNIVNGNLESHIGGILEPYRKDGYFLDMLRFIKRHCVANSLPYFIFGARNENAYVQKIFQEVGFKAIGSENVFHVVPLLKYSKKSPETFFLKCKDGDEMDCLSLVKKSLHAYKSGVSIESITVKRTGKRILSAEYSVEITTPVHTKDTIFKVFKIFDKYLQKVAIIYLKARPI